MRTFRYLKSAVFLSAIAFAGASFSSVKSGASLVYRKAIYSLPLTFDPIEMNDVTSLLFSEMVYEGLLRISNNYGYEGALAESWTTSRDGLTLTFQLRSNRKFHNGDTVTANDVVASLQRAASKKSKVASLYDCIVGAKSFHAGNARNVSGIRALSEDKVEIKLVRPFPPMMYVLAGATAKILPARLLESATLFESPIGSGPFKFASRDRGAKAINLERFANHPRLQGNIDRLILIELDEATARKQALQGQVDDLSNFPLTGAEEVFAKGQHLSTVTAQTWIIGMNSRLVPFKSLSERTSFRNSFDPEAFRKAFYPDAEQAFGYIPPGFPGHRSEFDSKLPSPKPIVSKEKVVIAIPEVLARAPEMAKYIESSYSKLGWKVEAKLMSWPDIMKGYTEKTLQAFLVSMNMDYPDSEFLLRNFESSNSDNFSGTKDKLIDRLLAESRATSDRQVRKQLYEKITDRVAALAPTVNLFHPRAHVWLSECVSNLTPNILSDTYIDYAKVSLSAECASRKLANR